MSRRKRVKISHAPHHHYPPLLLSPIVHDDQHHSLPAFPSSSTPSPARSSSHLTTPPPTATPLAYSSSSSFKPSLTPLTCTVSPSPSSLSSSLRTASLLSTVSTLALSSDPYLLKDDDLPDPDQLIAQSTNLSPDPSSIPSPLDDVDVIPATPSLPSPPPPPPVQRSLSYQSPSSPPPPPPDRPIDVTPPVRTISIPPLLDGLDDYPNLSEVLDEEDDRRRRERDEWMALEREMAVPLSELLDDAEEEEEEWERRMQINRAERRQRAMSSVVEVKVEDNGSVISTGLAVSSPMREEADEFAATQVVAERRNWVESQSQAERASAGSPSQKDDGVQVRVSAVSSASCGAEVDESEVDDEQVVERVDHPAPVHRFSRRIYLSNCSSLSPTPVASL